MTSKLPSWGTENQIIKNLSWSLCNILQFLSQYVLFNISCNHEIWTNSLLFVCVFPTRKLRMFHESINLYGFLTTVSLSPRTMIGTRYPLLIFEWMDEWVTKDYLKYTVNLLFSVCVTLWFGLDFPLFCLKDMTVSCKVNNTLNMILK